MTWSRFGLLTKAMEWAIEDYRGTCQGARIEIQEIPTATPNRSRNGRRQGHTRETPTVMTTGMVHPPPQNDAAADSIKKYRARVKVIKEAILHGIVPKPPKMRKTDRTNVSRIIRARLLCQKPDECSEEADEPIKVPLLLSTSVDTLDRLKPWVPTSSKQSHSVGKRNLQKQMRFSEEVKVVRRKLGKFTVFEDIITIEELNDKRTSPKEKRSFSCGKRHIDERAPHCSPIRTTDNSYTQSSDYTTNVSSQDDKAYEDAEHTEVQEKNLSDLRADIYKIKPEQSSTDTYQFKNALKTKTEEVNETNRALDGTKRTFAATALGYSIDEEKDNAHSFRAQHADEKVTNAVEQRQKCIAFEDFKPVAGDFSSDQNILSKEHRAFVSKVDVSGKKMKKSDTDINTKTQKITVHKENVTCGKQGRFLNAHIEQFTSTLEELNTERNQTEEKQSDNGIALVDGVRSEGMLEKYVETASSSVINAEVTKNKNLRDMFPDSNPLILESSWHRNYEDRSAETNILLSDSPGDEELNLLVEEIVNNTLERCAAMLLQKEVEYNDKEKTKLRIQTSLSDTVLMEKVTHEESCYKTAFGQKNNRDKPDWQMFVSDGLCLETKKKSAAISRLAIQTGLAPGDKTSELQCEEIKSTPLSCQTRSDTLDRHEILHNKRNRETKVHPDGSNITPKSSHTFLSQDPFLLQANRAVATNGTECLNSGYQNALTAATVDRELMQDQLLLRTPLSFVTDISEKGIECLSTIPVSEMSPRISELDHGSGNGTPSVERRETVGGGFSLEDTLDIIASENKDFQGETADAGPCDETENAFCNEYDKTYVQDLNFLSNVKSQEYILGNRKTFFEYEGSRTVSVMPTIYEGVISTVFAVLEDYFEKEPIDSTSYLGDFQEHLHLRQPSEATVSSVEGKSSLSPTLPIPVRSKSKNVQTNIRVATPSIEEGTDEPAFPKLSPGYLLRPSLVPILSGHTRPNSVLVGPSDPYPCLRSPNTLPEELQLGITVSSQAAPGESSEQSRTPSREIANTRKLKFGLLSEKESIEVVHRLGKKDKEMKRMYSELEEIIMMKKDLNILDEETGQLLRDYIIYLQGPTAAEHQTGELQMPRQDITTTSKTKEGNSFEDVTNDFRKELLPCKQGHHTRPSPRSRKLSPLSTKSRQTAVRRTKSNTETKLRHKPRAGVKQDKTRQSASNIEADDKLKSAEEVLQTLKCPRKTMLAAKEETSQNSHVERMRSAALKSKLLDAGEKLFGSKKIIAELERPDHVIQNITRVKNSSNNRTYTETYLRRNSPQPTNVLHTLNSSTRRNCTQNIKNRVENLLKDKTRNSTNAHVERLRAASIKRHKIPIFQPVKKAKVFTEWTTVTVNSSKRPNQLPKILNTSGRSIVPYRECAPNVPSRKIAIN